LQTFAGHGNSINDITLVPGQASLFLTASKDEAIRCKSIFVSVLVQSSMFYLLCEGMYIHVHAYSHDHTHQTGERKTPMMTYIVQAVSCGGV